MYISYKGTIDKPLLETRWVCVAMAGDWSVAMAGRKTAKDSVRVRLLYCACVFKHKRCADQYF